MLCTHIHLNAELHPIAQLSIQHYGVYCQFSSSPAWTLVQQWEAWLPLSSNSPLDCHPFHHHQILSLLLLRTCSLPSSATLAHSPSSHYPFSPPLPGLRQFILHHFSSSLVQSRPVAASITCANTLCTQRIVPHTRLLQARTLPESPVHCTGLCTLLVPLHALHLPSQRPSLLSTTYGFWTEWFWKSHREQLMFLSSFLHQF